MGDKLHDMTPIELGALHWAVGWLRRSHEQGEKTVEGNSLLPTVHAAEAAITKLRRAYYDGFPDGEEAQAECACNCHNRPNGKVCYSCRNLYCEVIGNV